MVVSCVVTILTTFTFFMVVWLQYLQYKHFSWLCSYNTYNIYNIYSSHMCVVTISTILTQFLHVCGYNIYIQDSYVIEYKRINHFDFKYLLKLKNPKKSKKKVIVRLWLVPTNKTRSTAKYHPTTG